VTDLLIRADASATSGAGHAMRTLALAEAWAASGAGQVGLVGAVELEFVRRHLANLGIVPGERLSDHRRPAVLVVDTYDLTARLEGATWRPGSLRVLVDDLGGNVPAGYDVVWNPGPWGGEIPYPEFEGTVLSGVEFAPIRAGLPRWNGGEAGRVAVLLGGGQTDPTLAEAMTRLTQQAPAITFSGVGAWRPPSWERLDAGRPWTDAVRASALVTAAGTSLLEAANVGIPVVVLCTADNQVPGAHWAQRAAVPVVDARHAGAAEVAAALRSALPLARPLPPLRNGAPAVARLLLEVARERGAPA
jgi:spore coat polysaccharide biosynthesis predicted glycosyltransferase SpsG